MAHAHLTDLDACDYTQWAPLFRRHTFKGVAIPLPRAFLHFLQEDGVFLHDTSDAVRRPRG